MKSKIRYVVPNSITFMSLACGFGSILLSSQEYLTIAGILVLCSYVLDSWDGFTARKLNAQTNFGLQLDSLADMVALGIAPAVLVFHHLMARGLSVYWALPIVLLTAMAGAFRLARFNLLPAKTGDSKDSVGLPITQSGGTLALAVLSDLSVKGLVLATGFYIPLLLLLSIFMVSTIAFPPSSWFFLTKVRVSLVVLYVVVFL
ncbi:MAG: CDP-alcohol phosphatidyltransferase family protein, partial [Chloroflexota bacterium]|nr:CDP-alcohol phosphatidyltransferase family protein [Chloroflexota bacterium]